MEYKLPTKDPEKLHLYQGGKQAPPVNVEAIANAMGIVRDHSFNPSRFGHSGEIFWGLCGRPTVWINPADPPVRQRFTLAHEIGHYILHMLENKQSSYLDDVQVMKRSNDWNSDEMQANRFAASLLMPRELVTREFQRRWFPWDNKKADLAKTFQVSEASMGYRLSSLGLEV